MEKIAKIMEPYGYCPGVNRALNKIEELRKNTQNRSIFCIGEPIHNSNCTNKLEKEGIIVLKKIDEEEIIKAKDNIAIFPAHGVSDKLKDLALENNEIIYDFVCPIVKDSYEKIRKYSILDYQILYIGQKNHQEGKTAASFKNVILIENDDDLINIDKKRKSVLLNQTTFDLTLYETIKEKIKKIIPNVKIINTLCKYVLNKHDLLNKELKNNYDGIIVVGDKNSKNANVLYEHVKIFQNQVLFINEINEKLDEFKENKKNILIVSSSSSDGKLVEDIADYLNTFKKINKRNKKIFTTQKKCVNIIKQ